MVPSTRSLTRYDQNVEQDNSYLHGQYEQHKVPIVIRAHTGIDPWAMAALLAKSSRKQQQDVLVMFRHTSRASPTVFASHRHTDHAVYTVVVLVKLPKTDQFINDGFLRRSTAQFRYVSRVLHHAD